MEYEIKLNDIADDLLILNKATIETLYKLDDSADCIALYLFYYKTAKWQKTNIIKASDTYVIKCLKWGKDKLYKIKNTLREHGLINVIQRRKDGKIEGWYIEVAYIVTKKSLEDIKIKIEENNSSNNPQTGILEESKSPQNQQVANPTSGFQDTNALKENNKCLNNNKINASEIRKQYEIFSKRFPKIKNPEAVKRWFTFKKLTDEEFKILMERVELFIENECINQDIQHTTDAFDWLRLKRYNAIYNKPEPKVTEEKPKSKYMQTTPKNAKFESSREYTDEFYDSLYE